MLRRDGEITRLPTRRRLSRERRVLMLIDVSGSMKDGTDGALRLAHALVQGGERVECFTIGTRLTRVTRALRHRNRDQALTLRVGAGRRLGRRHAARRGAGGLPVDTALRGPCPRRARHRRVRRARTRRAGGAGRLDGRGCKALAWSVLWLSPLAADPAYRPETGAMRAILPMLDRLGDGSTPPAIASGILGFSKGARA